MLELMHACKECVSTTPLPVGLTTTKQERNSNRRTRAKDKILIAGESSGTGSREREIEEVIKYKVHCTIVNTLF